MLYPSQPITRRLFLRSLSTLPRDHLILRFAALAKELSDQPPPPRPPPRPLSPHPYDYNRLMSAHAASGGGGNPGAGADRALHLLDEMRTLLGRRPDAACFTTAAAALSSASRPEAALAVLEAMAADGIAPDVAACTVLVGVYACRLRWFDSAYEVVRWMVANGVAPDVVTYSTLISGLCSAGRVAEALGVLDMMLEEECQPNAHTYTPIMHAYCVGAFKEVDKLLEESGAKGWIPDTITYSTYMDGLCKSGRVDKSFALVDKMLANGLRPNDITLNILLDGVCRRATAWAAKCLLECSTELGWHANVVNYNTVMRRLCDERKWLAVVKLFDDMFKKGIAPNSWTFSIVIHSLCKLGKLHQALCLLGSKEFVPNVVTYNTLIRHLGLLGKANEAYLMFHKMTKEGIAPNETTYGLVIDCLCRGDKFLDEFSCFGSSMEYGPSTSALLGIVRSLIAGDRLRELQTLIGWVLGQGFIIDVCMYEEMIFAFCKKGYCRSVDMYKGKKDTQRLEEKKLGKIFFSEKPTNDTYGDAKAHEEGFNKGSRLSISSRFAKDWTNAIGTMKKKVRKKRRTAIRSLLIESSTKVNFDQQRNYSLDDVIILFEELCQKHRSDEQRN
ncbi:hypothetical protein EJB05_35416, partial [Eragrostis curvula]